MSDTLLDLDALLDNNLSEIEDLPDYVTPPSGMYTLAVPEVKLEQYTKKGKDGAADVPNQVRLRLTYKIGAVLEITDPANAVPVAEGSLFSDTYMYTDAGLAIFKRQAAKLLNVDTAELSPLPLREIFTELTAIEAVNAVVQTKENDKGYTNTNVRPYHEA
jgi:hypothetical protein